MTSFKFQEILEDAGITLTTDVHLNHTLSRELPIVRYELKQQLRNEDLSVEFLHGLKEYLQDDDNFRMALNRTFLNRQSKSRPQKSLVHLLLGIPKIQDTIMKILLDKLPNQIVQNDTAFVNDALNALSGLSTINNIDTLACTLIECMDVADEFMINEMLNYLPMILSNRCNQIAKPLLNLTEYERYDKLAEPILQCLQNFYFSKTVKEETLNFIINRLLPSYRYQKIVPTIVDLLVHYIPDIGLILDKTRLVIDKVMNEEAENVKLELHRVLVGWPRINPTLIKTVLKTNLFEEPKSIDIYLILLLINYDSLSVHRKLFIDLIKKNVKDGKFTLQLWDTLFANYLIQDSIETLHSILLDIAVAMIESRTPTSVIFGEIGVFIYKSLFVHPLTDSRIRSKLLSRVKNVLMFEKCKNIAIFLKVLLDLSRDQVLAEDQLHLMPFITLHSTLSVQNMKIVFDIICKNIIDDDQSVAECYKTIEKLLCTGDVQKIKKGAVGAVILAKYQSSSTGTSNSQLEASQFGKQHPALDYLAYAKGICDKYAGPMGVYYDELALALSAKTSDKVVAHLHNCTLENFIQYYTTDVANMMDLRVSVKKQFELNDPNEVEEPLYINIGGLLQDGKWLSKAYSLVLPAMFRFLCSVARLADSGDVTSIDALLGCGVVLPDIDDLDLHASENLPIVADCLFLCINWFRELVSAFMCQKQDYRSKSIERIKHIILLEDKLAEIMSLIPNHRLPQSYFYEEPDEIGGSGSGLSATTGSVLGKRKFDSTINVTQPVTQAKARKKLSKKQNFEFREMGNDVMLLLKYPIKKGTDGLETKQFQFALRDVIAKMASLMEFRPRTEVLQDITIATVFKAMEHLLSNIQKNFCLVAHALLEIIGNKDIEDAEVFFTPEVTDLKVTFDLVINLYKIIFDWKGFQHVDNKDLFCSFLRQFEKAQTAPGFSQLTQSQLHQGSHDTSNTSFIQPSLTSANMMKSKFIENMSMYRSQCLLLSSAAALLDLLLIIREYMTFQRNAADQYVLETATYFLGRSWLALNGLPESGKEANDYLKGIISAYLESSTVREIKKIVTTIASEVVKLGGKYDALPSFKAVSKSNIHIFINCLCVQLYMKLKSEIASLLPMEQSAVWRNATLCLQILIDIGTKGNIANLLILAKTSLNMLNLFLKLGFAVIEKNINKQKDNVQELFNTWSGIQRFMHRIACQASSNRLSSIMNIVPLIRTALEKMRLKVKSTLVAFNCEEAFFEGELLNKNLAGEEIISQHSSEVNSDDENEDEAMEVDTESDNITEMSASEIFD